MNKLLKVIGYITLTVILLLVIFSAWYVIKFYPRSAEPFEVNSPSLEQKLLIATQGSEFKDTLVKRIVEAFKDQDVYIKVIDVSTLEETRGEDWWGVVIINASMMDKINSSVHDYLPVAENSENIVVITTSGGGDFVPSDLHVDGITTASRLSAVEQVMRHIRNMLNDELENTKEYAFK